MTNLITSIIDHLDNATMRDADIAPHDPRALYRLAMTARIASIIDPTQSHIAAQLRDTMRDNLDLNDLHDLIADESRSMRDIHRAHRIADFIA